MISNTFTIISCTGQCSSDLNALLTKRHFKFTSLLKQCLFRGCLCNNCKPSFLPLLIFNYSAFSRQVTARWWHQRAKTQKVLTYQSSSVDLCDQAGLWYPQYSAKIINEGTMCYKMEITIKTNFLKLLISKNDIGIWHICMLTYLI